MKRGFTALILFSGLLIVVLILQINNFQYSRVGRLRGAFGDEIVGRLEVILVGSVVAGFDCDVDK